MLRLIPPVKQLEFQVGVWEKTELSYEKEGLDPRIEMALAESKCRNGDKNGIPLKIVIQKEDSKLGPEAYILTVDASGIQIDAGDEAGAFYAVQTLKQIAAGGTIPYLRIQDEPDFPYRGFYHDITRGKIPTVETMKHLIDQMAYYKMNSLQIYVEHVYEFEECRELKKRFGYYTKEEMQELDAYCKERFIDFIPSLSTFGHMYEILEQEQYSHLRIWRDEKTSENRWNARMEHHTLDPLLPESEKLVQSLLDQYIPAFISDTFNICCDETFDLTLYPSDIATGRLYVDFTKKIIEYVRSKGKKIMMWGDILLEHPDYIQEIPEDTVFLNWDYRADPPESKIQKFSELGRKQILCPGTGSWRRLCEDVAVEEQNISNMARYGHKYGALGILNTNWGDWGNPASLELAMYGMVLGAAKSWSVDMLVDDTFRDAVNELLYGAAGENCEDNEKCTAGKNCADGENCKEMKSDPVQILRQISDAQDEVKWMPFAKACMEHRYQKELDPELPPFVFTKENLDRVQDTYRTCKELLEKQKWGYDEAREEMLIAIEGICVMAELTAKLKGIDSPRLTDTRAWIQKYSEKWEEKNKPCELSEIQELFLYMEEQI